MSQVAPLAGAWIEMNLERLEKCSVQVAPLAGAWIEMYHGRMFVIRDTSSLPSRERGLKCLNRSVFQKPMGSLPSRERGLKYKLSYLL